jgi:predicted AAA+ superfamily ATPase
VFLDEIQGSPDWAQHLKNIVDFEDVRLCVAGSSSLLLERQGTYLTGRALRISIFPLSYPEFLVFKSAIPGPTEQYCHEGLLIDYLHQGGYPEQILSPHPTYLVDLLDAVINKDVIRVHGIKNPDVLNKLLLLLAQRIGQRTSHSKLKNILRVSQDVVRDYLHHLMEAYLIGEVAKFSYSVNEQIYAEKEYYFADTGLRTALLGRRDVGGLAENALFIHLQKRFGRVFYGRVNSYEVDFVVLDRGQPVVFEAKFTDQVGDEDLRPLRKFLTKCLERDVTPSDIKATVVTRNLAEYRNFGEIQVELVPLWQLLLREG